MIVLTTKGLMIADDLRNNLLLKRKTGGICLAELGMMEVCFNNYQDRHRTSPPRIMI